MPSPHTAIDPQLLAGCAGAIRAADALLIAAGAGMGVDSGLPDFRGPQGFWRHYPALGRAGLAFQDIASPDAFRRDPAQAWGFYGHRLALYRQTAPHAGFGILARWIAHRPRGGFVVTSNVDGQFQRAGFDPQRIWEVHGSIHRLQCLSDCRGEIWDAGGFVPAVDTEQCRLTGTLPRCRRCLGLARPNILMFGDGRWNDRIAREQADRFGAWRAQAGRLVVIELGAGTGIPTIRRLGESQGATLIRINPREPQTHAAGIGIALGALDALRQLDAALREAGG